MGGADGSEWFTELGGGSFEEVGDSGFQLDR